MPDCSALDPREEKWVGSRISPAQEGHPENKLELTLKLMLPVHYTRTSKEK